MEQQLIDIYKVAFDKIVKKIVKFYKSSNTKDKEYTSYLYTLLKQIDKELKKYENTASVLGQQIINLNYKKEREKILKQFGKSVKEMDSRFADIHLEAITELQNLYAKKLRMASVSVVDNVRNTMQREGIKYAQLIQAGAMNTEEAIDDFLQTFSEIDMIRGKIRMNATSYAEMLIKTTQRQAINKATLNTADELDEDLVKMSYHSSSCPVCAKYEGRVYSKSGNNPKYPALEEINNGNVIEYGLVHPNCRHRFTIWIEEHQEESEIKQMQSASLEDTRSERSKKNYERQQKINYYNRELMKIERQLELIKAIPDSEAKKNKERKLKERKNKIKNTLALLGTD